MKNILPKAIKQQSTNEKKDSSKKGISLVNKSHLFFTKQNLKLNKL